jgi:hypothetical protein
VKDSLPSHILMGWPGAPGGYPASPTTNRVFQGRRVALATIFVARSISPNSLSLRTPTWLGRGLICGRPARCKRFLKGVDT